MSVHARATAMFRPQGVRFLSQTSRRSKPLAIELAVPRTVVSQRAKHLSALSAIIAASVGLLGKDSFSESSFHQRILKDPFSKRGGSGKDDLNSIVGKMVDGFLAHVGEISLGSAMGFCSGYALKQVGKITAVAIGSLFIAAQVAQTKGYVNINWKKVESDLMKKVDADQDGKLTKKDLDLYYKKLMAILQTNLPSSAGFSSGFLFAMTYA